MKRTCGNCGSAVWTTAFQPGRCCAPIGVFGAKGIPCLLAVVCGIAPDDDASQCPDWTKLATTKTHHGNPDAKIGDDSSSPGSGKRGRVAATKGR